MLAEYRDYDAPATWQAARKGEKSIAIIAPIVRRNRDDAVDEQSRTVLGFRAAYVLSLTVTS